MKKVLMSFAAIALMVGFSGTAMGQVSAKVNVYAELITPITITAGNNLIFGKFAVPASEATVTIGTDDSRINTGITAYPGDHNRASFSVTGQLGKQYTITLKSDNNIIIKSETNEMHVTDITLSPTGSQNLTSSPTTIYVGAKLTIPANQPIGEYSLAEGIEVQVNYN